MTTQPLIHIGYPKTGTTFFQKMLFPNHPGIRLFSIKSPGSAWMDDIYEQHDLTFDAGKARASYEAEMKTAEGLIPVISQESLIGDVFTRGVNFQRNALRLHAIFPEGKILIIIREQLDMIRSLYHQYCQEGGTMRLGLLLTIGSGSASYFDWATLDYAALLEVYRSIFGADQVKMMPFEQFKSDASGFVTEMLAYCGLDTPPQLHELISTRPINVRSTRYGLDFMRLMNRLVWNQFNASPLIPAPLLSNMRLRRITNTLLEPLFRRLPAANREVNIPAALQQDLTAYYKPKNRALSEQLGLPLESYGYSV